MHPEGCSINKIFGWRCPSQHRRIFYEVLHYLHLKKKKNHTMKYFLTEFDFLISD